MEHNDLELLGYQLVTGLEDFIQLIKRDPKLTLDLDDQITLLSAIHIVEWYSGFRAPEIKENIDETD